MKPPDLDSDLSEIPTPVPATRLDQRLRDNRVILGALFALLVVLTVFYALVQRRLGVHAELLSDKVVVFVLWYVNIILILTLLFILVRNLSRLIIDYRSRILGSRFKTKLVTSAVFLSLIPVLILFPFATSLLLDSMEAWFNLPIEEVVEIGRETALALEDEIQNTASRDAQALLDQVVDLDLGDLKMHPQLRERVARMQRTLQRDYIAVYDGDAFIHATLDSRVLTTEPRFRGGPGEFVREAIAHGSAARTIDDLSVDGRLLLTARAAKRDVDATGNRPHTVVMVGTVLPADLAEKSKTLLEAYQQYLQLDVQQNSLRNTYLLILLMMTLLVILAFTSISTRLARRVTVPIQALAHSTRMIRAGNLDHQIDVSVDDELGELVHGFNSMTRELKRNRELVERSNRELVDANRQVSEERLLLGAVLQNVAAGVLSIDAEGQILTCNEAALAILAQRGEEVIDRTIADAWADPERGKLRALLERDLASGAEGVDQLRLILGGVWKTLEVKVTTLPDSSGEPGGRVVVLEDLTALIQAQKMATWNEVARRIAHEIKNPLTPIRLTAERFLRKHRQQDPGLGDALEEGVEVIVREVGTLKNMVDEFSRFARMPRPQPKTVDLERLIEETLSLYSGLKDGIELIETIGEDARQVVFDPSQLKSVLINLLDNALEATDAPGSVTVSAARDNGTVLLSVADTGRGIAHESRDKLFLPYFSTKGRGTGLGLAIVHRIVGDHHAIIRVEDNHPRGTVFVLELPAE